MTQTTTNEPLTEEPVTISILEEADKEQARTVLINGYSQFEKDYEDPQHWLDYKESIEASLDNPNIDRVLVAKQGSKVLGSLQLFTNAERAYGLTEIEINAPIVRLLAVSPDARGKGVATKLLKESIRYALEQHAEKLYLHTTDKMANAISLYEKIGFERAYENDFHKHDFIVKSYSFDTAKFDTLDAF